MKIYTEAGNLAFKFFDFPDKQPHFKLEVDDHSFNTCTIESAIRDPKELFKVLLAADTLKHRGYKVNLDIRYLMGARMDRRISPQEPFTLGVMARLLWTAGFCKIRILDAHSDISLSELGAELVLPYSVVRSVINSLNHPDLQFISPDKGATERVRRLTANFPNRYGIVQCDKVREMGTGKLSGFAVHDSWRVKDKPCLIIDDICDGGGTFVGLAKELRAAGATNVHLYVTHGIFSKGFPLEGIDYVFCTDSYYDWPNIVPGPVGIAVSMKEME